MTLRTLVFLSLTSMAAVAATADDQQPASRNDVKAQLNVDHQIRAVIGHHQRLAVSHGCNLGAVLDDVKSKDACDRLVADIARMPAEQAVDKMRRYVVLEQIGKQGDVAGYDVRNQDHLNVEAHAISQ